MKRMTSRDPHEAERVATPLELFFDLVFVVAVSQASHELLHFLEVDRYYDGVIRFGMVFFAIWWAWMSFTWFASEYDTDDWLYRVMTLAQMTGVLIMAAGIADAFEELDNSVLVAGYVIMRLALVGQWVRAAVQDAETRRRAIRYAVGITLVQVGWVGAAVAGWKFTLPWFLVGVVLELAVPVIAEQGWSGQWHRHHLAERYSLFTIIVLGESVLASVNSVIVALEDTDEAVAVIRIALLGLVTVAAMWWIYFSVPQAHNLNRMARGVLWGYGHYVIFAAAAAVSAGIAMDVARLMHETAASGIEVAGAFVVPVALFTLTVWLLAVRPLHDRVFDMAMPAGTVVMLIGMATPVHMAVVTIVMVALVVCMVRRIDQAGAGTDDHAPSSAASS